MPTTTASAAPMRKFRVAMVGFGRAARSIDASAVQVTAAAPDGQADTYQKPLARETATAVRTALLKAWRSSLSIESD
jgi:hypothetical protein